MCIQRLTDQHLFFVLFELPKDLTDAKPHPFLGLCQSTSDFFLLLLIATYCPGAGAPIMLQFLKLVYGLGHSL